MVIVMMMKISGNQFCPKENHPQALVDDCTDQEFRVEYKDEQKVAITTTTITMLTSIAQDMIIMSRTSAHGVTSSLVLCPLPPSFYQASCTGAKSFHHLSSCDHLNPHKLYFK